MPHFHVRAVREMHYEAELSAASKNEAEIKLRDKIRHGEIDPTDDVITDYETAKLSA